MTKIYDEYIKTKNNINWTKIGNDIINKIITRRKYLYNDYNIFNGLDNLYPVNWDKCVSELLDKPYDNYKTIIREYQPLIVLVNSVYKKLESITEYEILNGNMQINYFIKKSFENKGIFNYFINKSIENINICKIKYL